MEQPSQREGTDATPDGRLRRVLIAVSLAMFLVQLDFFALNLALPQMARELHVTTTDMQWAISGYMLAVGALMIPGGRIGDILGRKRVLLAGVALFGVTSLAAGLSDSAGMVIAFRVLQGVGAAMSFPVGIAALTNAYPEERRQAAIGNAYGIAAAGTIERRVRFPLVVLSLFRNTPYVVITLAGMVSNVAFCVTTFAITIYLQQVRGLSPIVAGAVFLAPSLSLAVMGPVSGHIGERFRPIGPMATAIGAGSIGLLVLSGAHA